MIYVNLDQEPEVTQEVREFTVLQRYRLLNGICVLFQGFAIGEELTFIQ